jgi:Leucine-rich repeat (LRR) protein
MTPSVQSLPESISCLVELKALSLALNRLEGELSPALGGCTSLRLLDVSGNQLTVRGQEQGMMEMMYR